MNHWLHRCVNDNYDVMSAPNKDKHSGFNIFQRRKFHWKSAFKLTIKVQSIFPEIFFEGSLKFSKYFLLPVGGQKKNADRCADIQ